MSADLRPRITRRLGKLKRQDPPRYNTVLVAIDQMLDDPRARPRLSQGVVPKGWGHSVRTGVGRVSLPEKAAHDIATMVTWAALYAEWAEWGPDDEEWDDLSDEQKVDALSARLHAAWLHRAALRLGDAAMEAKLRQAASLSARRSRSIG